MVSLSYCSIITVTCEAFATLILEMIAARFAGVIFFKILTTRSACSDAACSSAATSFGDFFCRSDGRIVRITGTSPIIGAKTSVAKFPTSSFTIPTKIPRKSTSSPKKASTQTALPPVVCPQSSSNSSYIFFFSFISSAICSLLTAFFFSSASLSGLFFEVPLLFCCIFWFFTLLHFFLTSCKL